MRRINTEHAEQAQFVALVRNLTRTIPELRWLHSSLNGVRLTGAQAMRYKREGMVAGIPDLFLPFPVGQYHGLFLEMKTRRGRVSQIQDECITYLRSVGYAVAVCRGWEEAQAVLMTYMVGGEVE